MGCQVIIIFVRNSYLLLCLFVYQCQETLIPSNDFFKSIKGKNNTNDGEFTIGNLLNNKNVQNLLNNEKTKNILMDFASQMTSHAINPTILNKILDANPNISNELITERINSFKKDHPQSNDVINKLIFNLYQEKHSNKSDL